MQLFFQKAILNKYISSSAKKTKDQATELTMGQERIGQERVGKNQKKSKKDKSSKKEKRKKVEANSKEKNEIKKVGNSIFVYRHVTIQPT